MANKVKRLTIRQKRFILEYVLNNGHGTNAAIAAGYSKKTAYAIANQNLNKLEISKEIDKLKKAETKKRYEQYETKILNELDIIAFSDVMNIKGDNTRAINGMRYKTVKTKDKKGNEIEKQVPISIKLHSKMDALKTLSEISGLKEQSPIIQNNNLIAILPAIKDEK